MSEKRPSCYWECTRKAGVNLRGNEPRISIWLVFYFILILVVWTNSCYCNVFSDNFLNDKHAIEYFCERSISSFLSTQIWHLLDYIIAKLMVKPRCRTSVSLFYKQINCANLHVTWKMFLLIKQGVLSFWMLYYHEQREISVWAMVSFLSPCPAHAVPILAPKHSQMDNDSYLCLVSLIYNIWSYTII